MFRDLLSGFRTNRSGSDVEYLAYLSVMCEATEGRESVSEEVGCHAVREMERQLFGPVGGGSARNSRF